MLRATISSLRVYMIFRRQHTLAGDADNSCHDADAYNH